MFDLVHYIKNRIDISESDLQSITSEFKPKILKKGKRILRSGQTASEYYFVKKGCLRIYHGQDASEVTGWLATEKIFFGEISSISTKKASTYNIEAIEDSELLVISSDAMEQLYLKFPRWQEFGRKIWQEAFTALITRVTSYQSDTAERRYQKLLDYPELLTRVPLKYLASYLGVTPSSLSRLRKQIMQKLPNGNF